MKILLTNWDLTQLGGSQLWTSTMYDAYTEMGHECYVFSPRFGNYYEGINYINPVNNSFDIVIINQSLGLGFVDAFTIANCHSTFVPIENFKVGADKYISVSDEVRDIQKDKGFDSQVILNPVNHHIYKPKRSVGKKLKKILYLNHDGGECLALVKRAANSVGAEVKTIEPDINLSNQMNEVDVVIGIGRGLIEAMMCGRPVISLDQRSWMEEPKGFGIIEPGFFLKAQEDNYSGRINGKFYKTQDLIDDLVDIDLTVGEELRELAIRHHNYHQIALQYAKLLH